MVAEIMMHLRLYLVESGQRLGLGEGPFDVRYVANPGGFVNANFTIRSGGGSWHCKLAPAAHSEGLARWWRVRERLSAMYRAPRVVARLELAPAAREGLLLKHVPGQRADHASHESIWPSVAALTRRLHEDAVLKKALASGERGGSCFDYLCDTELAMLEADILETRAHASPPPFVEEAFWDWASREVQVLRELARGVLAFQAPAEAVVHGDLWEGNVLVGDDDWWIVDWDDLALGDPAKDVTDWWWTAPGLPSDASSEIRARLPLWQRTRQLVYAVDPLADWSEAEVAPAPLKEEMRAYARAVHEKGLARYSAAYGGP